MGRKKHGRCLVCNERIKILDIGNEAKQYYCIKCDRDFRLIPVDTMADIIEPKSESYQKIKNILASLQGLSKEQRRANIAKLNEIRAFGGEDAVQEYLLNKTD